MEAQYARILDTRLEAISENKVCYVLKEGSQVTSFVPLVSSSHSNSNTNFNLNNISDFTARDSRLGLGITVTATINVSNTTGSPIQVIQADNFGFKQYPLNRSMSSVQHQINQASYTLNSNDILDGIARVNLLPEDCNFYDNTMPDLIDNYAAATGTGLTPLASYSNTLAGDGVYKPRSVRYSVTGGSVAGGVTQNVIVTATLYEPLITPFTNISAHDSRALYAITGELIQVQWVSDLWNNMFAFVAPAGISVNGTPSVSLGSQANLFTIYLTPKENTIAEIPHQSVYQYNDYSIFTNTIASSVAPHSDVVNVNSQVVNFTNLPNKILVYARTSNGSRTSATPDKYLTIKNLTVQFDNGLPQFSGATTDQLYDISKRNSLAMPRACFRQDLLNVNNTGVAGGLYGCGSVMVIDPALDLGIRPGDSAGSGGRYIFQVQNATFTNNTDTSFNSVTLYVIGVNSAVLERVGSEYRNYLLTTPPDAVNRIQELPAVSYKQYLSASHANLFLMGGGVGDWFKKAVSMGTKAYDWAKKNKETLKQGYDVGKALLGKGMDRGSRLFGDNVRPARHSAFYQ